MTRIGVVEDDEEATCDTDPGRVDRNDGIEEVAGVEAGVFVTVDPKFP